MKTKIPNFNREEKKIVTNPNYEIPISIQVENHLTTKKNIINKVNGKGERHKF